MFGTSFYWLTKRGKHYYASSNNIEGMYCESIEIKRATYYSGRAIQVIRKILSY